MLATIPEPILASMIMGSTDAAFPGAPNETTSLFEQAEGGSVFLEEIGAMPMSIQEDLLDILRNKSYRKVGSGKTVPLNARILVAANDNLEDYVREGTFLEDLYSRINTISIEVPPLRNRTQDILPTAFKIIADEVKDMDTQLLMDPEVMAIFKAYSWPGNVRQLKNVLKNAIIAAETDTITKDLLPSDIAETPIPAGGENSVDELEKTRGKALREFLKNKAVKKF